MSESNTILGGFLIALGLLVLFNLFVSARLVFSACYTPFQKAVQLLIIWLLPIVGGLLVHSLIVVPKWKEKDHGFTADGGDNPPGVGLGGK